ncbi:unnamed protein product [Spirodela intermedia]|uniref:Uncharacterized protein n=1 Tax=Spirodela intermedia TaxID=51605 RepID=A0A7I8IX38_SPIIN|nr:unnamed protein product [Spirodela intermedia]CAA6661731.1 unnamed protein product [Spirodela intermedia]
MGASLLLPSWLLVGALILALVASLPTRGLAHPQRTSITRRYIFNVNLTNVTRLCHRKSIVTVNGQFPGPPIVAREGDRLLVKVINHSPYNLTLHWHGLRQLRNGWADGPAYITQCPIRPGQSYVYNFTVAGQRGTLWWHAHASWLRATIYGAIPGLADGGGPNVSDAYTINGLPGPLYNCSAKDVFRMKVRPGRTYLLRLVNAALNEDLFFAVAGHNLTVVEADAVYVKPFVTETLMITPGQTTNVLLHTRPAFPNATFLIAAGPYVTGAGTFDGSVTAGLLQYLPPPPPPGSSSSPVIPIKKLRLFKPSLPSFNDTSFVTAFNSRFRSLRSSEFQSNKVPLTVDRHFFFTVGLGTAPCPANRTCQGPNGAKFAAAVNNISFILPATALLQAHFTGNGRLKGVYDGDFPSRPLVPFNYTGPPPKNTLVSAATKVVELPFNTSVELVMQDTSILSAESHPLHLHGFNFFVVGQGFGNFDPNKDPADYNLVDPVERNTVSVPAGGWLAVRFLADNPGVWFMHCHLEVHTSWGLRMAWTLLPPPPDLPKC